jgi:ABC-type bacteriocin/lantibiotic exporter with double-glycine peptidase domain
VLQVLVIITAVSGKFHNLELNFYIKGLMIISLLISIYLLDRIFLKKLHSFKFKILNQFFDSFFRSDPIFFDNETVASTLKETQANMTRIESLIPAIVSIISSSIILLTLLLLSVEYLDFSFWIFPIVLLFFVTVYFIRKDKINLLDQLGKKLINTYEQITSNITNFLNNYPMIIVNNLRDRYLSSFTAYLTEHVNNQSQFFAKQQVNRHIFLIVTVILVITVQNINWSAEKLLIVSAVMFRVVPILQQLVSNYNTLIYNKSGLIFLISNPKESFEVAFSENKNYGNVVTLSNIFFGYSNVLLFKNYSLKIKTGGRYLLKGASGRGKSTLIKIILGLYKPSKGEVNYFFSNMNPKVYYCSQSPFLENETISEILIEIIKSGHDLSKLLSSINFSDDQFYPLDVKIGEGGKNLSGGQRQKIAILRAIFSKAQVIILDEPTSGFDQNSILKFHKLINAVLSIEQTLIIVSHDDNKYFDNYTLIEL